MNTDTSTYPYNLGSYSKPVSTHSADAQIWFDRGLNWVFGYNHEEATFCFKKALEHDASLAIAHWGIAYCAGPNYNMYWEHFDPDSLAAALVNATENITKAKQKLENASAVEQALINALEYRHPSTRTPENLYEWSCKYATKMQQVYEQFPDDADIATLYAESLMNLTPWNMWDPITGAVGERAQTLIVKDVLEKAIKQVETQGPSRHPGLLHLYIHLMEMSATPEVALRAADELRDLVPDAGHLKHMSTHIDVLCGHYQDVVKWNHSAIEADLKYYKVNGPLNFYSLYRIHNYHFKLYGAMFHGNYAASMDAIKGIEETIPDEFVRIPSPTMVNFVEGYMGMKTHALVRFGRWQQLIEQRLPEDLKFYCTTAATICYGKGVAHAALGNDKEARHAADEFEKHVKNVSEDRYVHVVRCVDILAVARELLHGEIEYHAGHYVIAFEHLRRAVSKEDALPYDEPWGWMMPSRHALGALLLEQGQVQEARHVYESDLGLNNDVIRSNQHPDNVWALLGLYECYERMGLPVEARKIKPRLDIAKARSDIELNASCFCSLSKCSNDGCTSDSTKQAKNSKNSETAEKAKAEENA